MRTLTAAGVQRPPMSRVVLAWLALGCLVLGLSLGTNFLRPVVRGLQVSAEIVRRTQEYRQQVRENAELRAELGFLATDAGKRWAAWRHLGLVEPGWQVGRTVEEAGPARQYTRPERLQQWLTAQQQARAEEVRQLGAILMTYGTGRAPYQPPGGRNPSAGGLSKEKQGTGEGPKATED